MTPESIQSSQELGGVWLPLVEYSLKSGVSLSTIRRKIKSNAIPFRLEKGRYLILFSGASELLGYTNSPPLVRRESPKMGPARPSHLPPAHLPPTYLSQIQPTPLSVQQAAPLNYFQPIINRNDVDPAQLPLIERTIKMVSDAFESTLKEKNEHIRLLEIRNQDLEERMVELQLLVKVLEEKYSIEY